MKSSRWSPTLTFFRSSFVRRIGLVAAMSLVFRVPQARALYVPDENQNPVWTALPGEPTSGPGADLGDLDQNSVPDWVDYFNSAVSNGQISYWSGGSWIIDGVNTTFGGQWQSESGDSDGDGLPDVVDPYPLDAANNSFYWGGGTFVINGIMHSFRADWYAGSGATTNNDGVPDSLDDWFYNSSIHGALQHWNGGTFLVNGEQSTFGAVDYYAPASSDGDGDGIPDEIDINPSDVWNGSSYPWSGGDFAIDGLMTHFPPATYGGAWADRDSDGIPDPADPLPDDGGNNSGWWQGGSFYVDGSSVLFPGQYHRADANDSDNDGIPDDIDPLPTDSSNMHTFDWVGGAFWINNSYEAFQPTTYYGVWSDTDGDGIPDAADPYPSDPNNANVTASYSWAGGIFRIDNIDQSFSANTFTGSWSDADRDGIPDPVDPYPNDAGNGNTSFYWGGGTFTVSHQTTIFNSGWYSGSWADSDGDGIPDVADAYPGDPDNGNNNYDWGGGIYRINNVDQLLYGGTYSGSWSDQDGDGIPDPADPYVSDPNNGNSTTSATFQWAGGSYPINNSNQNFSGSTYDGAWSDQDNDGIPDVADPYPSDPNNGNTVFEWAGGTFPINNSDQYIAGGTFPGLWADSDSDSIPDSLDPYPYDSNNGNSNFYWGGGTFLVGNLEQYFSPGYYSGTDIDSDSDGIPDAADPYPTEFNNGNTNYFYWVGGYFTINNGTQWFASGWRVGSWSDSDWDTIPDGEDPYPYDSNNGNGGDPPPTYYWSGGTYYVDGVAVTWNAGYYEGYWVDTDEDSIPDSLDIHSNDPSNNSEVWPGGYFKIDGQWVTLPAQWHRADCADSDGDAIPDDCDPYPYDSSNHDGYTWPETAATRYFCNVGCEFTPTFYIGDWSDTDSDGIPDVVDQLPSDFYNGNDSDSDGIPDFVEAQYPGLLDLNDQYDAANLREDGLTYLRAYAYGLSYYQQVGIELRLDQSISSTLDSDADTILDLFEVKYGLNPFDAGDAMICTANDYVINVEKSVQGIDPNSVVTESQYCSITGHYLSEVLANHREDLSIAENDWDGDGVSNVDEIRIFGTDCRSASSKPSNPQILAQMILPIGVSETTRINYSFLTCPPPPPLNTGVDSDHDGLSDEFEAWLNQHRGTNLNCASWDSNGSGMRDGLIFGLDGYLLTNLSKVQFNRPLKDEIVE